MLAVAGLLCLWPILLVVSLLVRKQLGTPVIFRQTRPGLHGKPFTIFKFRTMTDERDAEGNLLSEVLRLTRLGCFLRATSLDELPELWNVLKGDMSLVGPRPLKMDYLPLYTPEQARRHETRPGITGWAQINGRNALDWPQRFTMDVWYVSNSTFLLDMKIIVLTILKVFTAEGVAPEGGGSILPPFSGT